jgi:hypothetical protein
MPRTVKALARVTLASVSTKSALRRLGRTRSTARSTANALATRALRRATTFRTKRP